MTKIRKKHQKRIKLLTKKQFDNVITQLKDEFKKKVTIDKNTNTKSSFFQKLISLCNNFFFKKIDMTRLEKADLIIGLF